MSTIPPATQPPLIVQLGGRFMTSPEMAAVAAEAGVPGPVLYLRGRVAALGEVGPAVAHALLGSFPRRVVDRSWTLPGPSAARALELYGQVRGRWAQAHLTDFAGDDLTEMLLTAVDSADLTGLVMAAAWREVPRPRDAAGRLGHALLVAREVRGSEHFAALRTVGLTVPLATLVDPASGPTRLRRLGWSQDELDVLESQRAAHADPHGAWQEAERLTTERWTRLLLGTGRDSAQLVDQQLHALALHLDRATPS